MNARQFEKWRRKTHDIQSFNKKGTGHKVLVNPANGKRSELPMHGGGKQLGTGLMHKIKKDLGIA